MKGQAIAGMVPGIIGIVFSILSGIFSILGLPISIVGLVLSVTGRGKPVAAGQPSGIGTAGLVPGIIAVVFSGIAFFTCGICTLCVAGTAGGLGALL